MTPHEELDAALALVQERLFDEAALAWALRPGALAASAVRYATGGWPVFPVEPGGKAPGCKRGFHDATTDLAQIHEWWTANPQYNIGTPTGLRFDVIDIDDPDGFDSFAQLQTMKPLTTPVLAIAYTGGSGRHFLISPQGKRNGANLAPGLDYRGTGGYIVLPPSRLGDVSPPHELDVPPVSGAVAGGLYSWITPPGPELLGAKS